MTLAEISDRLYLPALFKGFRITLGHVLRFRPITQEYPEVKRAVAPGYRGKHKLNLDPEGHVKCVACYLCGTACPADAILIESAPCPPEWKGRDRFPKTFEIDTFKCVYCGFCEEACPVDAIVLTDAIPNVVESRREFVRDRDDLLKQPPAPWAKP